MEQGKLVHFRPDFVIPDIARRIIRDIARRIIRDVVCDAMFRQQGLVRDHSGRE